MTGSRWDYRVRSGERRALRRVRVPVRRGHYESLRDCLGRLIRTDGRPVFHQTILDMLNHQGLLYTWRSYCRKRIRIWWSNGDASLMESVRQFEAHLTPKANHLDRQDLKTLQRFPGIRSSTSISGSTGTSAFSRETFPTRRSANERQPRFAPRKSGRVGGGARFGNFRSRNGRSSHLACTMVGRGDGIDHFAVASDFACDICLRQG